MMWKQIIAYFSKLVKVDQRVDKNSEEVTALREDLDDTTEALKLLAFNAERDRANALHTQSETALRLENILLQHGIMARQELLPDDPEKAEMRRELEALRKQIAAQKQIEAKNSDDNETE